MGIELMMGLPGSTVQAFRNDLQQCTDRDLRVQVAPTQLLPNSPMNEPGYRKKHGIIAKVGEYVEETASYTHDEWLEMMRLRSTYFILDTYGVARYVARYVRSELGMFEIDFYDRLRIESSRHPSRWPVIARCLNSLEEYMAPPGSWYFFVEELRDFVVSELSLSDDSGLKVTLDVQLGHLPASDRRFPMQL